MSGIDFQKIIPMPKGLWMGGINPETRAKYGKNNWLDWSLANWGTKWNAFRFDDDVRKIVRGVRDFRMRIYRMTIVFSVLSVLVVAIGLWTWLPNVPLTDDPLRWALAVVLWLVLIVTVVCVEVKSFRLLDSIAKDLE